MALQLMETVFSLLFRLAIFIFLRVIPTTLGKQIIPTLFIAWISAFWLTGRSKETNKTSQKEAKDQPSPQSAGALTTIVLSLPTQSRGLRLANAAINVLLLLAAVEFVAYPFFDAAQDVVFTRIGAVYPDGVKITVRHPLVEEESQSLHIIWREAQGGFKNWTTGPELKLIEANDWVSTVQLKGLWPKTKYEYRLSWDNGTLLEYPQNPIPFRTFPDAQLTTATRFRFAVTSCIIPNFPYVPLQGRTIKGFDLLADYLGVNDVATTITSLSKPFPSPMEFMLFLGDFIYADVPVFIGDTKEAYRRLYRRNYQSSSFRKIYEKFPIFHAYDDHEILNNYAGKGNDSMPPFPSASDAFKIYNADGNYNTTPHEHHYEFRYADVAFFVMDTRRYRSGIYEGDEVPTMLGDKQLVELYSWLGRVNNTATFKFIVTSVPFTSLWGHDAQMDSWAGYRTEKAALLEKVHSVPNVIFLSGDRHEFAAIEFNSEDGYPVYEFSTSPLNMFDVPFFRTLAPESLEKVKRFVPVAFTEDSDEPTTVVEEVPQERVLKYLPKGNHKWSVIEVDTRNSDEPILRVEVVIDGKLAYSHEIIGRPVSLPTGSALGAFAPLKGVLTKMGINPSRWFWIASLPNIM
ncbi:hypothetical protein PC9H_001229 [Pleurotus ostreatus]|uniref:PhoD-like phosphatase metallophosphatase domain-containing protein n=1 Tax=Pleurotus ostreatus TaxID=5322 RepID=A0A8H7AA14_PLEOS|nr:uncharacterized protein PC9H_001229 [Pleurotus ostreatus]KAF7440880.1 hypothetical protein PC9H_001229 [Pleurotus ostreatus]KAJ8699680.1 hypothetical protein PTI98_002774 [Pleurotus ostreatus]